MRTLQHLMLLLLTAGVIQAALPDMENALLNASLEKTNSRVPAPPTVVLDGPIDPSSYILGPGDQLHLLAYNTARTEEILQVGSDGFVLLPGLGRVTAAGSSLEAFQRTWHKDLCEVFASDSCAIWLNTVRNIRVRFSGLDLQALNLELPYLSRLDVVLAELETQRPELLTQDADEMDEDGRLERPEVSLRRVLIMRDTETMLVDHELFLRSGEPSGNPQLESGDHVIVQARGPVIRTEGPFRQPLGEIEFRQGDTPRVVIDLLGGLHEGFGNAELQVLRRDDTGRLSGSWIFSEKDQEMDELALAPWDQFFVRTERVDVSGAEVLVHGEVFRPGSHAIEDNVTTLAELLAQVVPDEKRADLNALRISRAVVDDPELDYVDELHENSSLSWFERSYVKSRSIHGGASLVILPAGGSSHQEILLRDGDEIFVPHKSSFVEVLGAVVHPGFQPAQENWTVRQYLKEAGGKLPGVPKSSLKVRRAGSVQFVSVRMGEVLHSGDILMVPYREEMTAWQKFKEGLSVAVQLLTVVLVARSF